MYLQGLGFEIALRLIVGLWLRPPAETTEGILVEEGLTEVGAPTVKKKKKLGF